MIQPTTGAAARILAKHQLAEVLPGGAACTCGAELAALNPLDDWAIKGEPLALAVHQLQEIESDEDPSPMTQPAPSEPIVRILERGDCTCPNEHPELDEFVAHNVTVHFEAMGQSQYWIGVHDPATGRMWHINCGAVNHNAKGYSFVEEC
jgi:hypothetical protein